MCPENLKLELLGNAQMIPCDCTKTKINILTALAAYAPHYSPLMLYANSFMGIHYFCLQCEGWHWLIAL